MYLKTEKEVTRAQRPSLATLVRYVPRYLSNRITDSIEGFLLVNGAATEASASDKLRPT